MKKRTQQRFVEIISAKPISTTEKRPSIPANVYAAVRKALEKFSADWFTSAQDFVRALLSSKTYARRESMARWLMFVGLVTLGLVNAPDSLRAQASLPDSVVQGGDDTGGKPGSWAILGKTPDRRRLVPGMWAMHPFLPNFPELNSISGLAIQFSTWVFATFVNSYQERAFLVAVERNWIDGDWRALRFGAGFRVGLVTGYDERLFEPARHTPVLPFGGLLVWSQLGSVGVGAFYVYRAIALEASFGF